MEKENINITLGRLRGLIKYHSDTAKTCRMLDLLEIICNHIDDTDLALERKPQSDNVLESIDHKLEVIRQGIELLDIKATR